MAKWTHRQMFGRYARREQREYAWSAWLEYDQQVIKCAYCGKYTDDYEIVVYFNDEQHTSSDDEEFTCTHPCSFMHKVDLANQGYYINLDEDEIEKWRQHLDPDYYEDTTPTPAPRKITCFDSPLHDLFDEYGHELGYYVLGHKHITVTRKPNRKLSILESRHELEFTPTSSASALKRAAKWARIPDEKIRPFLEVDDEARR